MPTSITCSSRMAPDPAPNLSPFIGRAFSGFEALPVCPFLTTTKLKRVADCVCASPNRRQCNRVGALASTSHLLRIGAPGTAQQHRLQSQGGAGMGQRKTKVSTTSFLQAVHRDELHQVVPPNGRLTIEPLKLAEFSAFREALAQLPTQPPLPSTTAQPTAAEPRLQLDPSVFP